MEEDDFRRAAPKPSTKPGLNRFVWNLRYADATKFPGMILWGGSTNGPLVAPGTYTIEVSADGHSETQKVLVKPDPRVPATAEDYRKQLELALQIRDKFSAANQAVIDIRTAKSQLDRYASTADPKLGAEAKRISGRLTEVEEAIYQTKLRANEDALNFPIRLNNKTRGAGLDGRRQRCGSDGTELRGVQGAVCEAAGAAGCAATDRHGRCGGIQQAGARPEHPCDYDQGGAVRASARSVEETAW